MTVEPDRAGKKPRGCRVVTTSMSARLLLRNQLKSLTEIDWTVVSGDAYEDAPAELSVVVVPIRREFAVSDVSSLAALFRLFRKERYDFVQTHTPKASFLGLPAARLAGTPGIYTIHGSLFFRGNSRRANSLGWLFEKWCCLWARRVALQSREDLEVLPRVAICRRDKLTYIGNGIVMDHFTEPVEPAITSDLPIVLMISRLVAEKGCTDFFAMAESLFGAATFVHVGPGEHDQRDAVTEAEKERLSASGAVRFIGAVDDVRPYIAAADVVVLPSYREGIPRAAMEAAAGGRPIVAYDIRGVREVVDPELGLLATRGDIDSLTQIVKSLVADPDHRRYLGERCQEWVTARFSEEQVLGRLRVLYASMDGSG